MVVVVLGQKERRSIVKYGSHVSHTHTEEVSLPRIEIKGEYKMLSSAYLSNPML